MSEIAERGVAFLCEPEDDRAVLDVWTRVEMRSNGYTMVLESVLAAAPAAACAKGGISVSLVILERVGCVYGWKARNAKRINVGVGWLLLITPDLGRRQVESVVWSGASRTNRVPDAVRGSRRAWWCSRTGRQGDRRCL